MRYNSKSDYFVDRQCSIVWFLCQAVWLTFANIFSAFCYERYDPNALNGFRTFGTLFDEPNWRLDYSVRQATYRSKRVC